MGISISEDNSPYNDWTKWRNNCYDFVIEEVNICVNVGVWVTLCHFGPGGGVRRFLVVQWRYRNATRT